MDKRGGQEIIDYFYLNDEYRIEDDEIKDVASFRNAIEEDEANGNIVLKSIDGDRTTIEVTITLYDVEPDPPMKPMKPMKLVQDLADEFGADNLWYIYRKIYKYTDCGPSIGFQITNLPSDHESRYRAKGETGPVWFYCDDLGELGTLEEMKAKGQEVVGISVSSIVEGSDAEVSGDTLHGDIEKEENGIMGLFNHKPTAATATYIMLVNAFVMEA